MKPNQIIAEYEEKGFYVNHTFPNEYTLMVNNNYDKVRVYLDGSVWEADDHGCYQKIKGTEETTNGDN